MTMTLVQMADELLAIIEGERPRLNKTEMREYVRDLFAANAAHLTQPAQSATGWSIVKAGDVWTVTYTPPQGESA